MKILILIQTHTYLVYTKYDRMEMVGWGGVVGKEGGGGTHYIDLVIKT